MSFTIYQIPLEKNQGCDLDDGHTAHLLKAEYINLIRYDTKLSTQKNDSKKVIHRQLIRYRH